MNEDTFTYSNGLTFDENAERLKRHNRTKNKR